MSEPTLTAPEAELLRHMRQEEELARNVYRAFERRWGLPIFANIRESEERHVEAMRGLLERYGLADPLDGRDDGELADAELAALQARLAARGARSLEEALRVGLEIEELDIVDLRAQRRRMADHPAVGRVYAQLERASRNHLRAFHRQLRRRGLEPQASHLDRAELEAIAAADHEPGRGGCGGGPGGGRAGRGGGRRRRWRGGR